jgi:hypothetical protein
MKMYGGVEIQIHVFLTQHQVVSGHVHALSPGMGLRYP